MGRRRQLLSALGVLACLLALGLAVFAGRLERWARHELVDLYIEKVRPHLPFRIVSVQYEAGWRDLIAGRVPRLTLALQALPGASLAWQARLSGPLAVSRPPERVHLVYDPEVTLEPGASTLRIHLEVDANRTASALLGLQLRADADQVGATVPALGAFEAKALRLEAAWNAGQAQAKLGLDSLTFSRTDPDGLPRTVQLTRPALEASGPLSLTPFRVGPETRLALRGQGIEAAWGAEYLDLPWSALPLAATVRWDDRAPRAAEIAIGAATPLRIRAQRAGAGLDVAWESPDLDLVSLAEALKKATAPTGVGEIIQSFAPRVTITGGQARLSGAARLRPDLPPTVRGTLHLKQAAWRVPGPGFAAHGVQLDLPFSFRAGRDGAPSSLEAAGEVRAESLALRRLRARLAPTSFAYRTLKSGGEIRIAAAGRGAPATIPLAIEGLPVTVGALAGKTAGPLTTSFRLGATPIEKLIELACLKQGRLPPARVSADFSSIEITPPGRESGGDLDPTGEITVELFDGKLRVGEIGLFDFTSSVPELDFDADVQGVRLGLLGEWLGFGTMKGVLQGFAHDVTVQGWLPTHYDFSIDAKPDGGGWVDFSPEALKNLIELFAADSIDDIPGFAQWAAFGPPSHLLGGYDVKYAGLSLFSNDGVTLMESHDIPEVLHWKKKRYVIWGRRFEMPMPLGSHYPLVVDATAMGNLLRHMVVNLEALSRDKQAREARASQAMAQAIDQAKNAILPLGVQTYESPENPDKLPPECTPL